VTSIGHDPVELFRDVLEEQFQRHADQLGELISCTRQPDRGGYDEETLIARTVSSRRALADTAAALRRIAEDTYGTCKRCAGSIPLERLHAVPQTPFCLPCQQVLTGWTQTHSIAGLAFDGDGYTYSDDADSPAGSASTHRLPGGEDGSEQLRRP
jgi:RNA polymerase-binding transcription factor